MRPVETWFGNYSEDHRNPTNKLIHWICVPLILWTVIAALWTIPVPAGIGRPGLWAGIAMALALAFYFRLSTLLGVAMLVTFVVLGFATEYLYRTLGPVNLLIGAAIVFALAWVGQFIGHGIEGKRPSFFTDMFYLLIGPAWLVGKVLRKLGLRY